MIATALTFAFGFLAATLIALVVSPLFWSRSRRLALREYRATIPASAREIRASLDHVRAEAAVSARRRELKAEAEMDKAALARAEAGRIAGENAELRARNTVLAESVAALTDELSEASEQLSLRDAEIETIESDLRAVGSDLEARTDELDALSDRFDELGAIADERKAMIVELETRVEDLSDALREAERDRRESVHQIERLRGETSALQAHLAKEKNAVKRLDEKGARLASQLADRDDQVARLLGEAASSAALAGSSFGPKAGGAGEATEDDDEARGERRLRLRPAVRPAFGRRSEEAAEEPKVSPLPAADPVAAASIASVVAATAKPAEPAAQTETPNETEAAAEEPVAAVARPSLAETLGLSERPEFPDDLGDDDLRQKVGELAARVIALTAEKEGPRSPLDAILDADATIAPSGPGQASQPSLADRVRRLREETRDHAAE
ncbi:hypothetical protein E3C22_22790 [Jiella endophytica]|uniref:Uncharacterized protein n=1 Tax=Jiella endophytica TaxID=2558362 RepID=A0A4Y8RAS3_9HYPH|nr:hypothetical protein [Jiella endophytica]TFF17963.1 hypothetical protein E3C22_22790 [Jiella endophytica]